MATRYIFRPREEWSEPSQTDHPTRLPASPRALVSCRSRNSCSSGRGPQHSEEDDGLPFSPRASAVVIHGVPPGLVCDRNGAVSVGVRPRLRAAPETSTCTTAKCAAVTRPRVARLCLGMAGLVSRRSLPRRFWAVLGEWTKVTMSHRYSWFEATFARCHGHCFTRDKFVPSLPGPICFWYSMRDSKRVRVAARRASSC